MSNNRNIQVLFHKLHYLEMKLIGLFSTIYCKLWFRVKGIQLGGRSKFFGVPITYLYPGSSVSIGSGVDVRSSPISNLIGLNRKTIFATHDANAQIVIGDNCGFSGVAIGAKQSIVLGNHVVVGANSLITDFDWHAIDPIARKAGESSKSKPIYIADNVFIGYSSTILKGVTIGENSVIGANSVVTSNIPPNVIAAGNPCKVICALKT